MTKFIKLTGLSGEEPIWVNTDQIFTLHVHSFGDGKGTAVRGAGDTFYSVQETPEEIVRLSRMGSPVEQQPDLNNGEKA